MKLSQDLSKIKIGRVTFRSSEQASIYEADNEDGDGEQLVATFTGECRVRITKPCIRVLTQGDIYWLDPVVDQTNYRTSDIVYTSLDRPAPLSPEMLRLEQMVRRNAIDRDRIRSELEEIRHERQRSRDTARSVDKTTSPKSETAETATREVSSGSDEDALELAGEKPDRVSKPSVDDVSGTKD